MSDSPASNTDAFTPAAGPLRVWWLGPDEAMRADVWISLRESAIELTALPADRLPEWTDARAQGPELLLVSLKTAPCANIDTWLLALRRRVPVVLGWLDTGQDMDAGVEQADRWIGAGFDDVLIGGGRLQIRQRLLLWRGWLLSQQMRQNWQDMQRVERMKNEFLATVHHELRTPLTSIVGSLSLLSAQVAGTLPDKARLLVDMAHRNAQRLSRLIDDVLDIAKLEEERIVLHPAPHPLSRMLTEAVHATQAMAERQGVTLELRLPADGLIRVDADRFVQVMSNLLSNAIKHSGPGDAVSVRSQWQDGNWTIGVTDQGPGVPSEFMSRLFEKFAQADGSDRRARGGTGLGLYISRLLVQRMGGEIGVDSTPGMGATFHVRFAACAETGRVDVGSEH